MKLKNEFITLNKSDRLYGLELPLIGLTGSIATGKSSVTRYLKNKYQLEIIDADQLVKEIYKLPKTIELISTLAPDSIELGTINFKTLRKFFFKDDKIKTQIENFIYSKMPEFFLEKLANQKQSFVVYDVPLLYEKKLQSKVDVSILVYTSPEIQLNRLKKRDNITEAEIEKILQNQIPIDEKRKLTKFIINNDQDIDQSTTPKIWTEVDQLINLLMS